MSLARRQFLKMAALTGAAAAVPSAFSQVGTTTLNSGSNDLVPATYRHWREQARRLLEPLAKLMTPERASLDIHGPASANGANSDRLESVARPMLLAAHYLQSAPEIDAKSGKPDDAALAFREKISAWFRQALLLGTQEDGPQSWGPDANYHQIHVEMGLLCLGLQIAMEHLWTPFSATEKTQIARWLGSARHSGYVDNNHYFMGIHVLEFLRRTGQAQSGDAAVVDEYFDRLEKLHRGGGWFQDGINQAYDYYNAYAFNFYGLWWAHLHGDTNPTRAKRWRDWSRQFVADYEHFFAASGEHPAFGRSITYRFNSIAPFGLAVLENTTDLPLGRVRRLCTRNLDFFLRHPIFQDQGCLAVGWLDRFEASAEGYTGAGSPYWAAKGFSPLLLPPQHAFWSAAEEPLQSERGDHARVIKPAGLLLRSAQGEVEILNAGSQISHTNLRYGAWKWSKTAYRTGAAFTCAFPAQTNWSPDSALTWRTPDNRIYGRHSTVATELTDSRVSYRWALGYAPDQTNVGVDTTLWWRAGWILQVHAFDARQPGELRLGGFALPATNGTFARNETRSVLSVWNRNHRHGSVLQALHGFDRAGWDERVDETKPRAHLAAPFHATPLFFRETTKAAGIVAALVWTGSDPQEAEPWQVVSGAAQSWTLRHPILGEWSIAHRSLPEISFR